MARKIRGSFNPEAARAIGLERNGNPVAGVFYEGWNHKSVVAHIAIEGRLTPLFLYAIFHYPFQVLGVHKVIAPVAESNEESIRLVKKMGFIEEARLLDAHPDGALIFFTMTPDRCRFIGEKYGKRQFAAAGT